MRIAFCIHPAEYLLLLQEGKTAASDEDDLDLDEDESEGVRYNKLGDCHSRGNHARDIADGQVVHLVE